MTPLFASGGSVALIVFATLASGQEYRPLDGRGTNRMNPSWGASGDTLRHGLGGIDLSRLERAQAVLAAAASDTPNSPTSNPANDATNGAANDGAGGQDTPRLPGPREVSNALFGGALSIDLRLAPMTAQFGQLLAHDIVGTGHHRVPDDLSLDIPVPPCDPHFDPRCTSSGASGEPLHLMYRRTFPAGEIPNVQTAFVDASVVYGTDEARLRMLRAGYGGRLRTSSATMPPQSSSSSSISNSNSNSNSNTNTNSNAESGTTSSQSQGPEDLLPLVDTDGADPLGTSMENPRGRDKVFAAGDGRANVQPGQQALHTLFVREHNRLAAVLAAAHPAWGDEILFQEARRRVIAQMQAITYREYFPAVLGFFPAYAGYDERVDPGIESAVSTAAFRYGHATAAAIFMRRDPETLAPHPAGPQLLRDALFNPAGATMYGIDAVIADLLTGNDLEPGLNMVEDIRSRMPHLTGSPSKGIPGATSDFGGPDGPSTFVLDAPSGSVDGGAAVRRRYVRGFDLASTNVQRGRDQAIHSLNGVRQRLGLPAHATFTEMAGGDVEIAERLSRLYASPDDVDLFVGGLAEAPETTADLAATDPTQPVPDSPTPTGSVLGPTFSRLIRIQFVRIRGGDRFWYERDEEMAAFVANEGGTLADLVARNTRIDAAFARSKSPFSAPSSPGASQTLCASLGAGVGTVPGLGGGDGIGGGGGGDGTGAPGGPFSTTMLDGKVEVTWTLEQWSGGAPGSGEPAAVAFTITAETDGWVGIGFGSAVMAGADFVIGWVDDASGQAVVGDYTSVGNAAPVLDTEKGGSGDEITDVSGSQEGGKTTISFTRPVAATDANDDVDRPLSLGAGEDDVIVAFGRGDADLVQHSASQRASARVSWSSGSAEGTVAGGVDPRYLYMVHGVSMAFAWGFVVPLGIFFVRLKSKPYWLSSHKILMGAGIAALFPITITLVARPENSATSSKRSVVHVGIGVSMLVLALGQVVMGFMLGWSHSSMKYSKMGLYRALHRWLGRALFVMAQVQVAIGFHTYGAPVHTYVIYYAMVAVLILMIAGAYVKMKRTVHFRVLPPGKAGAGRGRSGVYGVGLDDSVGDSTDDGDGGEAGAGPADHHFTMEEVKEAVAAGRLLTIIHNMIIDVSEYQFSHPGGPQVIKAGVGKDSTLAYVGGSSEGIGQSHTHSKMAWNIAESFRVGYLLPDADDGDDDASSLSSRSSAWFEKGPENRIPTIREVYSADAAEPTSAGKVATTPNRARRRRKGGSEAILASARSKASSRTPASPRSRGSGAVLPGLIIGGDDHAEGESTHLRPPYEELDDGSSNYVPAARSSTGAASFRALQRFRARNEVPAKAVSSSTNSSGDSSLRESAKVVARVTASRRLGKWVVISCEWSPPPGEGNVDPDDVCAGAAWRIEAPHSTARRLFTPVPAAGARDVLMRSLTTNVPRSEPSRDERVAPVARGGETAVRVEFFIRVHPGGAVSPHLAALGVGDSLSMYPSGSGEDLTRILHPDFGLKELVILGAGTGIAPGIALLQHAKSTRALASIDTTFISVLRRGEDDAGEEIDRLARAIDARTIHFTTAGGKGTESSSAAARAGTDTSYRNKGRPTKERLARVLGRARFRPPASFAIVCGPQKFEDDMRIALVDLGFEPLVLTAK